MKTALLTAALLLATVSTWAREGDAGPVWPPRAVQAPAEVAWRGELAELRPRGAGRLLQALTGASGSASTWRLTQPVAVALHGNRVFIVDTAHRAALACDRDGKRAVRLDLPEGFVPVAVAFDRNRSRVMVADRAGGEVRAFAPDGSPLGEVSSRGVVEQCGGLSACANGDLLLTDARAGQVVRLTGNGREVARAGRRGSGPGEYNLPGAVVEAPDGTIWVLDTFNFRVQRLDRQLQPIGGFGEHGDSSGQIALAKGLAVDPDGHVYLSDARFDVVQVFDREGRLLLVIGGHGSGPGGLWNPAGLTCSAEGEIAVADTGNRRVQLFDYRRRRGIE